MKNLNNVAVIALFVLAFALAPIWDRHRTAILFGLSLFGGLVLPALLYNLYQLLFR